MEKKNTIKDLENTQKVHENSDSPKQETDNPHDKGYKRIFSIKKNFLDFIKKYIGFDWMMELTEKDLVLIDKEFITDQFDTYESDLVYKVNTKKGSVYLFFLLELQSYNDFTMPFRLLVYITAIWLDYFKNCDKDMRRKKSFRLPAVVPIVLHNGERWITWFSNVIRKLNEEERTLLIEQIRKGDVKHMCSSFERLLMKENAQGRKQGKIEGKAEGRIEGRIEGKIEGKIESVLELLEELGEPSETLRKYIMEQTDLELLSKWHKIAARTESIEEFEESIGLVQLQ